MLLLFKRFLVVFYAGLFLIIYSGISPASTGSVIVSVVVEPAKNNLGYTTTIKNKKLSSMEEILNELARNYSKEGRIVVLFHPNAPVRSFTTIRSLTSKVGYTDENTKIYAFDEKRRGMIEITFSKQFVVYSADPDTLKKYFD